MIVCAGRNEIFDFARPIGVGLIESAANLSTILREHKPKSLIFIGSAGSYGKHKIFDIVCSNNAVNIEIGYLLGKSYTPLENKNVPRETKSLVNSSNYITCDAKLSKEFLKIGVELENMEFFSVVWLAKQYNIPIQGIFVVTNFCDKNAHKDFLTNHEKAKILLENYMKDKKYEN